MKQLALGCLVAVFCCLKVEDKATPASFGALDSFGHISYQPHFEHILTVDAFGR
jgi:hypothetical protein